MKKTFLSILAIAMAGAAMALPAKHVKRTSTLADGSQVEATFAGDEYLHYYVTADGTRYVQQADGTCVPLQQATIQRTNQRRAASNKRRISRRQAPHRAPFGETSYPISGSKKGIVILVNFADKAMNCTQAEFNDYFNKQGYNHANMNGSVHDYFYSSSYGKFDLTFDVVGPYTLSHNMAYYGQNDKDGNDMYPAVMISEAVKQADKDVDFSQYDWDGDGQVDQVYVIYAGYGEASDAPANTIWPHEFNLTEAKSVGDGDGPIQVDGVTVDNYATSCELRGKSGNVIDGVGTACHEFSHCMGIPDFYDTSGKGFFGMDVWSVMDYGCYNGQNGEGESPWTYTSYERMYCGWLTPTELTDPTTIKSMKPLSTHPEAYILRNNSDKNDYYLLENRQLEGFDQYGYGHGLMVLHVRFDKDAWINNTVNSTATQRMTIVPADGSLKGYAATVPSLDGDPYPGTQGTTKVDILSKPITEIAENNGKISFLFDGGKQLSVPTATTTSTTTDGFTASWSAVEGATSYEVRLIADDGQGMDAEDALLLSEDFAKFNGSSNTDHSTTLDAFTGTPGWSGQKVFDGSGSGVKIGSSKGAGTLSTPTLTSQTGQATVSVTLAAYGSDKPTVGIKAGNNLLATVSPTTTPTTYTYSGTAEGSFKVTIASTASSKQRFYISSLKVYDGEFTEQDLTANTPLRKKVKTTHQTDATAYTFTHLDAANTYSYQVRALSDDGQSPWSAVIPVTLAGQTGISELESTTPGATILYDLSGRRILDGNNAKGVVIVKRGGKTMKIIKK